MSKKVCITKTVAIIAAFTMVAGVSASCFGNDGKIHIKLGMWPENTSTQDVAMFNLWKTLFEEENPQYVIDPSHYTYNPTTIGTDAQARTLPTVFETWFTEPEMLISRRVIRDITPQLDAKGWSSKMDEGMKEIVSDDNGRIYGIPRDGYGLGMALNLAVLYDYGIIEKNESTGNYILHDTNGNPLYPTSFSDISDMADVFSGYDNAPKGLITLTANKTGGWQFSNIAWNFGAKLQVKGADGKWKANLNDPKAIEALQWINQMNIDEKLTRGTTIGYQDWQTELSSGRVAAAFVGNDALQLAITNGGMALKDLAFVPMPKGPRGDQKALFGGTPFVFSSEATDEQVEGTFKFLEYMGRCPDITDISLQGLEDGNATAVAKGIPVIPIIKPWTNPEYVNAVNTVEAKYSGNINMDYYKDFYALFENMKTGEEPLKTQEMYAILDQVLQDVMNPKTNSNCTSLLTTANATFQKVLDDAQK